MWVIVWEPSGVKSLVLRGLGMRTHRRGMDAACRGDGAIAGVFSRVELTVRKGPGGGFGVLGRDCVVATGNDRTGVFTLTLSIRILVNTS